REPAVLAGSPSSDARAEDVTADEGTRTKRAAAIAFLREQLADGPLEVEAVKQAAAGADISEKPLREARERVCRSYRPGGNHGPYVWELTKREGIHGHSESFTHRVDAVDDPHIHNGHDPDVDLEALAATADAEEAAVWPRR